MEELILTWPQAFAVVASVVTIVSGLLAYLLKPNKIRPDNDSCESIENQLNLIHQRLSDIKDRVATEEGDVKVVQAEIESLARMIRNHEVRDEQDFIVINQKLEKLMDIVLKLLSDDRL